MRMVMEPPPVIVRATENRGHSVEEWSDMLTDRLVAVSDNAPQPIRDQANSFKRAIKQEIIHHITEAIRSDRLTMIGLLRKQHNISQEEADYLINWGM